MSAFDDAYTYAASYCSTAERCRKDLLAKIARFELDEAATERLLERLMREGFLDEARFARAFAHDALRFNKWGRLKIRQGLQLKALPEALISQALEELEDDGYTSVLVSLLQQKRRQLTPLKGRSLKERLYRFALSRGFETDRILTYLNQLIPEGDGELDD